MLYAVAHSLYHGGSLPPHWRILGLNSLLSCGIIPNWGKDPIGIRPDTYPWELGGAESGCVCVCVCGWESGRRGLWGCNIVWVLNMVCDKCVTIGSWKKKVVI